MESVTLMQRKYRLTFEEATKRHQKMYPHLYEKKVRNYWNFKTKPMPNSYKEKFEIVKVSFTENSSSKT